MTENERFELGQLADIEGMYRLAGTEEAYESRR
jgi:hypothetical protein